MPIQTTIAPSQKWRYICMALLCVVFGLWGAYDLWIKLPADQHRHDRFNTLVEEQKVIETKAADLQSRGLTLLPEERQKYESNDTELKALSPDSTVPEKPGQWDTLVCWFFIACLPCAPFIYHRYLRLNAQRYTLDESGALIFKGDPELGADTWPAADMGDIDMSRWMAKSIAHLVHTDGRRLKLDAYMHKNLDLIIGAIASRLKPAEWDAQAKPVKKAASPAASAETQAADSAA